MGGYQFGIGWVTQSAGTHQGVGLKPFGANQLWTDDGPCLRSVVRPDARPSDSDVLAHQLAFGVTPAQATIAIREELTRYAA